ncbi:hypothetical protein PCE1_001099 [Barthelona sp. PCE]
MNNSSQKQKIIVVLSIFVLFSPLVTDLFGEHREDKFIGIKRAECPAFVNEDLMREIKNTEKVDFVYTWVNGSDPNFLKEYGKYSGSEPSSFQYSDNFELFFSLRSIEEHIDFGRNVVLYTNGQVPYWLNTSHPDLRIVFHEDVFPNPKQQLPTFNSRPIEATIPDIPGLSEVYIYMNDDLFFKDGVTLKDFIADEGMMTVFRKRLYHRDESNEHWMSMMTTYDEVFNMFDPEDTVNHHGSYILAHTPRVFHRDLMKHLMNSTCLSKELLGQRFRQPYQFDPDYFAIHAQILLSDVCRKPLMSHNTMNWFKHITNYEDQQALHELIKKWPQPFYNLNDFIDPEKDGAREAREAFRREMLQQFPNRSRFEMSNFRFPKGFFDGL